ncbi:MAG TPA: glycoside hydrolase family 38 C-terminal domain-containing protein [Armatimonadota bacterium]|nr:glycoside hydrolase family 38 C-terminal domain-containing protein [Armatimonadota bacterium]
MAETTKTRKPRGASAARQPATRRERAATPTPRSARAPAGRSVPKEPLTLHVVSHTHWDREWYLTYQQFRMRLVEAIDNVLQTLDTDPSFKYFHLDGQTIVLEDYLQIRPQNEARLRRYVKEGRLLVGPWYQLMDEYLVSGESIIRSLLIGGRIARDFGASMPVGYLADQFGNVSQMPQIFRGFGIDNCVFGRGLQLTHDRKVEFKWRSPDGSEVLCSLMAWWYNNAQRIPSDPAAASEYLAQIAAAMAPHCGSRHLLLMNGVDHLDVQEDAGKMITAVTKSRPVFKVAHSSMPEYVEQLRASNLSLWVHEGEMREDRGGSILAGVLSARLYLKQSNSKCETLLERSTEPLMALGWLQRQYYDRDFLRYAWKRLMWNHPHDSICGCSVDQVHQEMEPRFDEVEQIAEELAGRAAHGLSAQVNELTPCLVVFNTLGFERMDLVEAVVDFPLGLPTREGKRPADAPEPRSFSLWDSEDREVSYQISDVETVGVTVISPVELPMIQWVKRFRIKFIAEEVPSLGYRVYRIDASRSPTPPVISLVPYSNAMENVSLLVEILSDGTLHVLQKATEQDYEGLVALEDGGDCGDEYHYMAPTRDEVISTSRMGSARVSLVESGPVVATYRIEVDLALPAALSADRHGRSEARAWTRVVSLVSLAAGSNRIAVRTTIDNQSRDHRLRVLFPTGIAAETADAEGQFDVLSRPSRPPVEWHGAASTHPQQSFVDVSNGADGLCILNKGLTEYELLDDQDSTIALTLIRCVGRLSSTGDGPPTPTPDAQCLGSNSAEFAIYPHAGSWLDARAWQEGHAFRTPLRCVQKGAAYRGELATIERQDWRRGLRPLSRAALPTGHSYLFITPDEVILSAFKLAEDRDALVVRLFNISPTSSRACLTLGFSCARAWKLNLNEDRQSDLKLEGNQCEFEMRAREIVTLEFSTKT